LRDLTQLPTLREFQELSEESRKIVEDEAPRPAASGLADLAQDPVAEERMIQSTAESESALQQLETAIEQADESSKSTVVVLTPPPVPEPPKGE
jgi:segregation and condensation protein B